MKRRKNILLAILTALLLVIVAASYIAFTGRVSAHMKENVKVRLKEIVAPNQVSFEMQMQEQIKKVKTFAQFLGESGPLGSATHEVLLKAAVENNGLLRCAIAFPDGSFITHDQKNEGSVAESDFFTKNMQGEFFITDPRPAVVDDTKTVILFTCPIYTQGEIIGSVIYSYLCDDMDSIFNLKFLDDAGLILVAKADGTPLMGEIDGQRVEENLLAYLQEKCSHADHTLQTCITLVGDEGSFVLSPKDKGSDLYLQYNRLQYNDWYLVSMAPENVATKTIATVTTDQRDMGVAMAFCVLAYFSVLALYWVLNRRNVDKMTGALTLDSFKSKAARVMRRAHRKQFVFVKFDVKSFKLINRVYNYSIGNLVICNIAHALRTTLIREPEACFARVGTDDFLVLIPYAGREKLNAQRAEFVSEFRRRMGAEFTTTVEFPTGQYVLRPEDFPHPDIIEVLEKVNFAHRASKHKQVTAVIDYEEDIEREALVEKSVGDRMEDALKKGEFRLYLQPKYRVSDATLCGAEALVRWMADDTRFLMPSDFVPVLERNGFIVKIDIYMFTCAVQKIHSVLCAGKTPCPISVNFSRCHFGNEGFTQELCAITKRYSVPNHLLEIEVTESAVFDNLERMIALVEELHTAGFLVSMDDFGSGYSCLAQLKELDVDIIKLDRGFFTGKADMDRARVVVASMLEMAQKLQIKTVAEGIETLEQVEMLRSLGCDVIQGYYYGKPVPAELLDTLDGLPLAAQNK